MLLRLRQACDHPLLVKGNQSEYGGDGSIEMAKQLPKEVVIDLLAKVEVGSALCTLCNVSILISHHHFGAHRFLSPFPFLGVIILIFVYYWMILPPNTLAPPEFGYVYLFNFLSSKKRFKYLFVQKINWYMLSQRSLLYCPTFTVHIWAYFCTNICRLTFLTWCIFIILFRELNNQT